jgi:hypothetical protein
VLFWWARFFFFFLQRKISYLCIELNLSRIDMMLQLKISHELSDIVVIDI